MGIKEVNDGIWLACFMDSDLGYIDLEEKTLQPCPIPLFQKCYLCLRCNLLRMSPDRTMELLELAEGFEPPTL